MWKSLILFILLPSFAFGVERLIVRVDVVDIGTRERDELPAELQIERGIKAAIDPATLRVLDEKGESLPLRWYDEAIPYHFPETQDSISRSEGRLDPKMAVRGGFFLNAVGDGKAGRLVWMHTQIGNKPSSYVVEFDTLPTGSLPKQLAPQGWIGDGQARCSEKATQTAQSDMQPRVLLGDLNADGDDDLYFPSTQGSVFVERSFLNRGYARASIITKP